jgi:hypothetical protein
MEAIIVFGAINLMIWTSILMYRMAKKYLKKESQQEINIDLPPYEDPPPPYTPN